ncbi:hypothetical protein DFH11DRAFT_960430 [Phellopilus nigrolimitatus]|nr:hypothetical protein DFH11DRAFT_960430 [Phellopilus nigrolimitatus]
MVINFFGRGPSSVPCKSWTRSNYWHDALLLLLIFLVGVGICGRGHRLGSRHVREVGRARSLLSLFSISCLLVVVSFSEQARPIHIVHSPPVPLRQHKSRLSGPALGTHPLCRSIDSFCCYAVISRVESSSYDRGVRAGVA